MIIGKKNNVDVVISLREFDPAYVEALDHSIEQAEKGNQLISMTMEDFMSYQPQTDR